MISDLHCAVLFYPEFSNNNVMHTAVDVVPRVSFIKPTVSQKKVKNCISFSHKKIMTKPSTKQRLSCSIIIMYEKKT